MTNDLPVIAPAAPEIFLAVFGMLLMMAGVFSGARRAFRSVSAFALIGLLLALAMVVVIGGTKSLAFHGQFLVDGFAVYMKALVLIGAIGTLVISDSFLRQEQMARFEYPVLIVFACLGMMMMISANDLIALYLGLELQSLALYVVAAFRRDSTRSTEAGLKYFVLGALASGLLLYGCSLIYGFGGTTDFALLAERIAGVRGDSVGLLVGLVFLLAGLAFKVSAVPFHMWTPDVYEGAPTPVTAFFAVAPKIAAIALLLRVMLGPFEAMADDWRQIIVLLSVLSMALGAFAAINQSNIKRLMAYSSIGHVGYALIGLAAGGRAGVTAITLYMTIYLAMTLGTFGCILCMRRKAGMVEEIDDLAGLGRSHPRIALALLIFMFSMAGIPPMAGFFGKLYIFMAALDAGLVSLAVIGVLTSVVGAFYYIRIVKVMYFDDPAGEFEHPIGRRLSSVLSVTALFTAVFVLLLAPILEIAEAAAASLF